MSLEHEALSSFLLAHSPPAKNVTQKKQGEKNGLIAEDVRAPLLTL